MYMHIGVYVCICFQLYTFIYTEFSNKLNDRLSHFKNKCHLSRDNHVEVLVQNISVVFQSLSVA